MAPFAFENTDVSMFCLLCFAQDTLQCSTPASDTSTSISAVRQGTLQGYKRSIKGTLGICLKR